MFSTLHRLLPFFNRGQRASQSTNLMQGQDAALTQQRDDSEVSEAWSTLSRNDADDYEQGNRFNVSASGGRLLSDRSQRIIKGAISQLNFRHKNEFVVHEDISNGRERYKVPALSYKRHDYAPDDYHYVTECVQYEPVDLNRSLVNMSSCTCSGDCGDGKCRCSSAHKSGRCYDSKGRLTLDYNVESPEVIYECNVSCGCNRKTCKNMIIQDGCKCKLVLFRTRFRGWGIRTIEHLKRGTLIGFYSGELISASSSRKREDDTYLFNLASTHIYHKVQTANDNNNINQDELKSLSEIEKQEQEKQEEALPVENLAAGSSEAVLSQQATPEQFVCDAKFYGNFTRFINHSCEPNVIGIRSFTDHHDSRFPYISFFTNKDVPANTELTLNYGDNYWLVKCKRDHVFCLCKRPNCRFSKKTFARTLAQHNQQQKQNQNK